MPVAFMDLAQSELAVVGVEDTKSPNLVFERQRFSLEFDLVPPGYPRAHIDSRGLLLVGMPELEHDLRVPNGESVHITHASPQDEGVVVKAAVGSVTEDDFSDLWPTSSLRVVGESNFLGFRGSLDELAEIAETF